MQSQFDSMQSKQITMVTDIALILQEQKNVRADVSEKHAQNRKDIHALYNLTQDVIDKITNIRISNARWNIGAGIITAIVIKIVDHLIK